MDIDSLQNYEIYYPEYNCDNVLDKYQNKGKISIIKKYKLKTLKKKGKFIS